MTKPFHKNACAGHYDDWLEVMLTDECNGKCPWCVEKNGWHPKYHAPWRTLRDKILELPQKNVMLLGGEPTLYTYLPFLINNISSQGCGNKNVFMTTNGELLSRRFCFDNQLNLLSGINISLHHYKMKQSSEITGAYAVRSYIKESIAWLKNNSVSPHEPIRIRLNCNLIKGYIDNSLEVANYLSFAKDIGATCVRFAELKFGDSDFVFATQVFSAIRGFCNIAGVNLPEEPFADGCSHDYIISGLPVNIRIMCGLQAPNKPRPINPENKSNKVLYYDGNLYGGWQTTERKNTMEFKDILKELVDAELSHTQTELLLSVLNAIKKEEEAMGGKHEATPSPSPSHSDISEAASHTHERGSVGCMY